MDRAPEIFVVHSLDLSSCCEYVNQRGCRRAIFSGFERFNLPLFGFSHSTTTGHPKHIRKQPDCFGDMSFHIESYRYTYRLWNLREHHSQYFRDQLICQPGFE